MSRLLDGFSSLILQDNAEGSNSLQRFCDCAGCDSRTSLSLARIRAGISEVQFWLRAAQGCQCCYPGCGIPTVLSGYKREWDICCNPLKLGISWCLASSKAALWCLKAFEEQGKTSRLWGGGKGRGASELGRSSSVSVQCVPSRAATGMGCPGWD